MKYLFLITLALGVPFNSVFAAHADQRADALLKQAALKSESVYALTANVEEEQCSEGGKVTLRKGTIRLLKPNYYRVVWEGKPQSLIASDGITAWYKPSDGLSQHSPAPPRGMASGFLLPIDYVFVPVVPYVGGLGKTTTVYCGTVTSGKIAYRVVEVRRGKPGPTYSLRLFIGPDNLIHLARYTEGSGRKGYFAVRLKNILLNPSVKSADFAYTSEELKLLTNSATAARPPARPSLLPIGSTAPDFVRPQLTGMPLALQEVRKTHKLILINFWFYG